LGYSYYEYAESLKEEQPFSALLYAEYSLELSNLDIYFKPKKFSLPQIRQEWIVFFVSGIIIGASFVQFLHNLRKKRSKKSSSKRKKS
jgi:hypothetical protein